jgi:murein DD-endopeptidase MepM/ murein hydrolase activator NlpD
MLPLLGLDGARSGARPLLWTAAGLAVLFVLGTAPWPPGAQGGVLPVAGATVTQAFGCTSVTLEPADPACASGHFHSGVDLAIAEGAPVRSVCAGDASVVLSAVGYGVHVIVDCGGGLQMVYAHLAAAALGGPAPVAAGQLLGWVGSTGLSTGPHLHFEVRRDGVAVDPMPWVPAYAGTPTPRR